MLHITLCDDDRFTLQLASEQLKKAISLSRTNAQLCCVASSGGDLLRYLSRFPGPSLTFLDFDFGKGELNGIDLVRRISRIDPDAKVVFVTSHTDRGMDILKSGVRAFGFIEKAPDPHRMIAEYVKYLRMAALPDSADAPPQPVPKLALPLGIDEVAEIAIPDISWVDSVKSTPHTICYHTFDGSRIAVRDTMDHAQELLGETFLRCHRSVLVNREHVVSLKNGMIRLSNGESVVCAVSRRREIAAICFSKENIDEP